MVRYSSYDRIITKENQAKVERFWYGKTDSVDFGYMRIQRVVGNDVIVDKIDTRFAKEER
jgi:hypothetical protein